MKLTNHWLRSCFWILGWIGEMPITTVGESFDRAVRESGIESFRFHDLRHTWAS